MKSLILNGLMGEGLEAFEDQPDVPAVPSIDPEVCEEEIAVVEAATEAVQAESQLLQSAGEVEASEALVDAQSTLVIETAEVVASMESFIGSPMSKQDALALQLRVIQATGGQYGKERIVGSVESFGTDIATDDALRAGLEGIGEYLIAAKNKLTGLVAAMRARVSGFFKDAFVNFDKVAKRSAAVQRLAKGTTGESNASAVQLKIDTAMHLVKEGKLVSNMNDLVSDLSKASEAIMKDHTIALAEHRKKFIELVSPLAGADLDAATEIAKKIAAWRLPKVAFAKSKIQTSSRTVDLFRGDVLPGDEALYLTMLVDDSSAKKGLREQLDFACDIAYGFDVSLKEVAKKPNKLDLAVDTLKPAEMVKITEAIDAMLADIKQYSKTWYAWEDSNTELDRLMNVLINLKWEGDSETYEGTSSFGDQTYVEVSTLNVRLANTVYYINTSYGYLSTQPTILLAKKLIVVMNRILEVCERSLATYSDNSLK